MKKMILLVLVSSVLSSFVSAETILSGSPTVVSSEITLEKGSKVGVTTTAFKGITVNDIMKDHNMHVGSFTVTGQNVALKFEKPDGKGDNKYRRCTYAMSSNNDGFHLCFGDVKDQDVAGFFINGAQYFPYEEGISHPLRSAYGNAWHKVKAGVYTANIEVIQYTK